MNDTTQNTTDTQDVQAMTERDLYNKLCAIHAEIAMLDADIKQLLDDGKELGYNSSLINQVAKASTKGKISELEEKAQDTIEMIEELTS